jgi:hypothetical protein
MFSHEFFMNLLGVIAVGIGGWIASRIKKPTDLDRAKLLAEIARDSAALVVTLNPTADWGTIVKQTVDAILNAAGLPTRNLGAVERAAAAALLALGRKP